MNNYLATAGFSPQPMTLQTIYTTTTTTLVTPAVNTPAKHTDAVTDPKTGAVITPAVDTPAVNTPAVYKTVHDTITENFNANIHLTNFSATDLIKSNQYQVILDR